MYQVVVSRTAEKSLLKIPKKDQSRVITAIFSLADHPFPPGSKKLSGEENTFRIRIGNYRVIYEVEGQTAVVEACQTALQPPRVCRNLKLRRKNIDKKYIDIADRCMKRLHKKSTRMLYGGKMKNKIKVACARELLCFVWESLRLAA